MESTHLRSAYECRISVYDRWETVNYFSALPLVLRSDCTVSCDIYTAPSIVSPHRWGR